MTRWLLLGLIILAPALAQATLPAEEQWREGLLTHHVGFGTPTGGAGGTLCTVTTLADSGTNSFRDCATKATPQWVIFSVSGTITLTSLVQVGPNKTIDGRGADITISGEQLWINGDNSLFNVIIHNITFQGPTGSGHAIWVIGDNAHDVWFDHISVGNLYGDEAIMIGCGSSDTQGEQGTISWSHFVNLTSGGEGPLLISPGDDTPCNASTQVTQHHNYYEQVARRAPHMRFAKVHSFNNYIKNTQICTCCGNTPPQNDGCFAIQAFTHGQLWSENDIFECADAYSGGFPRVGVAGVTSEDNILPDNVKVSGQWSVTGEESYEQRNEGTVFAPSSYYTYTAATADATLRDAILHPTMGAGRVENPYNYLAADSTPPGAPTNLRVVSP